jgi:hypothetical protein
MKLSRQALRAVDFEGSPPMNVAIRIGLPRAVEGGKSFECLYQLMGVQCGSLVRSAQAEDPLHALLLAARNINAIVNTLPHQYHFS